MKNKVEVPLVFSEFLKNNEISIDIYDMKLPRYFMWREKRNDNIIINNIKEEEEDEEEFKELMKEAKIVKWLVEYGYEFYSAPAERQVAHLDVFKDGRMIAMDPISALAVVNLSLEKGEHVLDLCCAPGTKLALIADKVCSNNYGNNTNPNTIANAANAADNKEWQGSVTGVDISRERLGTATTLTKRFKLPKVRLFRYDGRTFDIPPHEIVTSNFSNVNLKNDGNIMKFDEIYKKSKNNNFINRSIINNTISNNNTSNYSKIPLFASTCYRRFPGSLIHDRGYDKVLVDAQCTHDGSIKHVQKYINNSWNDYDENLYTNEALQTLYELQYGLLQNGFKLLSPGGILVYSTCSLTKGQNELIIARFMAAYDQVAKIEIPLGPKEWQVEIQYSNLSNNNNNNNNNNTPNDNSEKKGIALRILPSVETGGGFFLCRIRKLC